MRLTRRSFLQVTALSGGGMLSGLTRAERIRTAAAPAALRAQCFHPHRRRRHGNSRLPKS